MKKTFAKHLIIGSTISLFILFVICSFVSCDPDIISMDSLGRTKAKYVYTNKLNYDIQIISYNNNFDSVYYLQSNHVLEIIEDIPLGSSYNNYKIVGADSVILLFDSFKYYKYYPSDSSSRNILKKNNYAYSYTEEPVNHPLYILHNFKFEFDILDYQNALPTN
jgi:hypothetical protein